MNKLLERQISKYIPDISRDNPELEKLLRAVSDSYDAFEKAALLSDHHFTMNENDYRQQFVQLKSNMEEAKHSQALSEAAKDLFLTNMSHEIRTPMNAIMGMGKQLLRTTLDSRQQFFLSTINKASEHLLTVINDILDISKIEAGKLYLEHTGFRPEEVISHCIRVMQHKAE